MIEADEGLADVLVEDVEFNGEVVGRLLHVEGSGQTRAFFRLLEVPKRPWRLRTKLVPLGYLGAFDSEGDAVVAILRKRGILG